MSDYATARGLKEEDVTLCPGCNDLWVFPFAVNGKPAEQFGIRLGNVLVSEQGKDGSRLLVQREAFVRHQCQGLADRRNRREEFQKEMDRKRRRSRKKAAEDRKASSEWIREAMWTLALKVQCPKCEQHPFLRCLNLVELRRGERVPVKWPHAERIIVADPDRTQPWSSR